MSKVIKVYKTAKTLDNTKVSVYNEIKKYNPYHGADGRFASANGMALAVVLLCRRILRI